jgi:NAD(P)-dependent dehydrogenase (short-subunit alcohol dehydrogenase family)
VIDYGAAKAALLNVAKAVSQELGPKGIRINSISPGPVATDLWLGDHGGEVPAGVNLGERVKVSERGDHDLGGAFLFGGTSLLSAIVNPAFCRKGRATSTA